MKFGAGGGGVLLPLPLHPDDAVNEVGAQQGLIDTASLLLGDDVGCGLLDDEVTSPV